MRKIRNPKSRKGTLSQRDSTSEIYLPVSKVQNPGFFIYSAILIFSFVFAASAFAVGGETEHVFTWRDWVWPVINFAILAVVLVLAARKPLREYFKKRTEIIEKSLKEAEEAKALAQKTLDETMERLKNTEREVSEILDAAKNSGEKEREALIAEGERLKSKILKQAGTNIEFELQRAKEAIKSEAAIMAIEIAEKQIKERLGKKEHETLIDDYIKKLAHGSQKG